MHAHHAGNELLGLVRGRIHRHHGRKARTPQPQQRIALEAAVVPHAGAHRGLGKLQQHRRNAADEQADRVVKDFPGDAVRRRESGRAVRVGKIHDHAGRGLEEGAGEVKQAWCSGAGVESLL